ncbi:glycosyl hydrolase family 18 protein [Vibrio sp. S4M6]|uniref:glycosyl hydrolase family 18 protein n=1 Tax=Vibrio sinus TaxID=2946865 RepID=UPI00202A9FC3|nr:glycosyl hydrolase family 18 protein [Vibrio sinus]MCL9780766.1 glycosyl hydrolase family 18 protein [Vibrio sinus]
MQCSQFLKVMLLGSLVFVFSPSYAFNNVAYVETNDNALSNVACFVQTQKSQDGKTSYTTPFFNEAVIFAANIHGSDPNNPSVYLNKQDDALLNDTTQVATLQSKGIKVLAALLGDHENSGWSCMTDANDAKVFADKIADFVQKYHLDGIAIDDEYSTCTKNDTSMIMIVQALKQNPKFTGKVIQKVLLWDKGLFATTYGQYNVKLADFLDSATPGYYPGDNSAIEPYTNYGMSQNDLYASVSTTYTDSVSAASVAKNAIQQGYGGLMVFNLTANSTDYVKSLAKAEYGSDNISVTPNCLK